jgi:L-fuconolactonase
MIDAHCHMWRHWPFPPGAQLTPPWQEDAAQARRLLFEMDDKGVTSALVVASNNPRNPGNNDYVTAEAESHPGRLWLVADLTDAADQGRAYGNFAARLTRLLDNPHLLGFTYRAVPDAGRGLPAENCEWLAGPDGQELLGIANDKGLLISLAAPFIAHPNIRAAARRFPNAKFLLHHMAQLTSRHAPDGPEWAQVRETARVDNIHLKFSGFYAAGDAFWRFPHEDAWAPARELYRVFGPARLHWGSDYPMCLRGVSYAQALHVVSSELPFLGGGDRQLILGAGAAQWLGLPECSEREG